LLSALVGTAYDGGVGSAADISGKARPVSTPPAGARPSCTEDDDVRRQAVAFFLGDAAFMADAKFITLARRLPSDDDFNSAVGAFFRALAAARRNGKPDLDMWAETGSRFIPDLVAVGLLCETGFNGGPFKDWSPTAPQALAGAARAASAVRTPAGMYASAASALDPAGKLDQPSPPLPSVPLSSSSSPVARAREDDPVADVLFGAYGGNPSKTVLDWGDRLADQYGARAAADAIGTAFCSGHDKLMGRAEGILKLAARHADMVEREQEQEKVREGHRPLGLAEVVPTPDPQKVGVIMEGLRAQLGFRAPEPKP